jgi:hypothetical protein
MDYGYTVLKERKIKKRKLPGPRHANDTIKCDKHVEMPKQYVACGVKREYTEVYILPNNFK